MVLASKRSAKLPLAGPIDWPRKVFCKVVNNSLRSFSIKSGLPGALHITIAPQFLKGIFFFLVLRPARAFRGPGISKLVQNLSHGSGARFNGKGAGGAADAAVTLTVGICKIERNDRNIFSFNVFPHIQFGP